MNVHRAQWSLDPKVEYLNHGSFGAVSRVVETAQREMQRCAEENPNLFFRTTLPPLVRGARARVASWLGVSSDLFAFIPNASQGVITAASALVTRPGSQIVATSLGYGGVILGLSEIAHRTRSTLRIADIAFPSGVQNVDDIVDAVFAALTPDTSLVVLDQITSETVLLLPLEQIVRTIRRVAPRARVVIDGAHAAGMLNPVLPADFDVWVGNFHKWLCAPRPSAGLVCRTRAIADLITPLAPSWGLEDGFPASFDWQGTSDYTSYLTTPNAIDFYNMFDASDRNAHNRRVVDEVARQLHDHWGTSPDVPTEMFCPWMRLVRLPLATPLTKQQCDALVLKASTELKIETVVMSPGDATYVRLSAHIYNEVEDFESLRRLPELAKNL